jgi:hypothetical protein
VSESPWRKDLPCLEDERMRYVLEEPNSFTTIGSGEESRVLTLEVLQTSGDTCLQIRRGLEVQISIEIEV